MQMNWPRFLKKKRKGFRMIGVPFHDGGWVKRVTGVDFTRDDENALVGTNVPGATCDMTVNCPPGLYAVYSPLWCYDTATKARQRMLLANAYLFRITEDEIIWAGCGQTAEWPLILRQKAAEILELDPCPIDAFSTAELEAALARRRSEVER